ncbi:hypothetical protein GF326_12850 [Candidatus Bathyarchaeota archaeon]|nr:hypothetical protein [Candidatus Bathyarchaeota archaeon]
MIVPPHGAPLGRIEGSLRRLSRACCLWLCARFNNVSGRYPNPPTPIPSDKYST